MHLTSGKKAFGLFEPEKIKLNSTNQEEAFPNKLEDKEPKDGGNINIEKDSESKNQDQKSQDITNQSKYLNIGSQQLKVASIILHWLSNRSIIIKVFSLHVQKSLKPSVIKSSVYDKITILLSFTASPNDNKATSLHTKIIPTRKIRIGSVMEAN